MATKKAAARVVRRNVVPDRLDLRDRPYQPAVRMAPRVAFNVLGEAKLPVLHQHATNACTGFALASVVHVLLHRAGRRKELPVSPFMLYSMARRYDEFPGYTADEGSSVRGAMKGWFKHGACAARLWTREPMPAPKRDPATDWWADAAMRPLGAYYRVDTRAVTDMHVALNEVGVLYASVYCHTGWDEGYDLGTKRRAWTIPVRPLQPNDGGHAFAIVGYDRHGFLVLNSWGTGWGDGGVAVLTYEDWLEHAMDCWVAQLGVVTEQHVAVAHASSLRTEASTGSVTLATEPTLRDRETAAFVIDMENNGALSASGLFRTQESDLKALVTQHLRLARTRWGLENAPIDVAIYAHGGVTGEAIAAATAARWIPALYEAQIFPIFLMWETDLFSTIKNRCADVLAELAGLPRPTAGIRDQIERFWNTRLERTLAEPGSWLWDEMKQNADAVSGAADGGARLLYEVSMAEKAFAPGRVRLHLIGHSAGAILHSHVVQRLGKAGWSFATVSFLAPAARVDLFASTVVRALRQGTVARYHQFHLEDAVERKDPTCRPILLYGRSLLYLVSESFEHGIRTPILGMETYYDELVRSLPATLRERMRAWSAPGPASASATHGGFDDDARTLASVVALIKGRSPGA